MNNKPFLNMDERNKRIAYKVIAVMYFLTIIAMQCIVLYRQFALGQEMSDFEDIAVLLTINSIFLISAFLYFGALPIRRLTVKKILLIYLAFIVFGSVFIYIKYNIFQSPGLSPVQLIDKLKIVSAIIGLLLGFWIILLVLGKKRIEKDLD